MGFAPEERAHLLSAPQIGPRLLARLEAAGFGSLAQMRAEGAASVMSRVWERGGHRVLANRIRAMERALAAWPPAHAAAAPSGARQAQRA